MHRKTSEEQMTALRYAVQLVAFCILSVWISSSISGASYKMNNTIMLFVGVFILATTVWIYQTLDNSVIDDSLDKIKDNGFYDKVINIGKSNIFRGAFALCFSIPSIVFLSVN